MNKIKGIIGVAVAVLGAAMVARGHAWMAAVCAVLFAGAWLQPRAELGTATLVVNILTGKVFDAFRVMFPKLDFFSTDFGKTASGFAQPAKWEQEIISQMAIKPTVADHTPGDDLSTGAQNVKDLVTDVKVKINRAKRVVLKLPTADAVTLFASAAFNKSIEEGMKQLGEEIALDILGEATLANFSKELVQTVAGADYDSLDAARRSLNDDGALTPRFVLGNSTYVGNIALDPRVASGDYHAQKTEADPYISLKNIQGFQEVKEFPAMPSNTEEVGIVVATNATNIFTLEDHGLSNGERVRFTTETTLPSGIVADTDYFVRDVTADTFKVSATAGGAAVDLADDGTGDHTVHRFEAINAIAFEQRAFHVAFRQLEDNTEMANQLGIPQTILTKTEVDPRTGLAVTIYLWQHQTTRDVYAAIVVAYGVRAGRALSGETLPGEEDAGTAMDYAAVRLVETAAS